jgi:hypothetical protein
VITATNVLAHVADVHDFLAGVDVLLAPGGVFVTENHDVASILDGLQFDTVYHEHLRYYSVASLSWLLERHLLSVAESRPVGTHGGSFRVYARKRGGRLGTRAKAAAESLHQLVKDCAGQGAVYGVGATTRATPLIHYAQIAQYIECVAEVKGSQKIGQAIPGTSIPVVAESRLIEDQPEFALLLAWHIASGLRVKLRAMGYKGRFIIPLPEARLADG